jgi:hypothetical protein
MSYISKTQGMSIPDVPSPNFLEEENIRLENERQLLQDTQKNIDPNTPSTPTPSVQKSSSSLKNPNAYGRKSRKYSKKSSRRRVSRKRILKKSSGRKH